MTSSNYVSYKHLHLDLNSRKAILLGYELPLTKTEYKVLGALIQSPKKPLKAEQIIEFSSLEISDKNLVYHISCINKKAKSISNRILIKNLAKNGYFLNEEM